MKIYMYMGIFTDNPEPDISLFQDKQDCLDFLNSEIDRYCNTYHLDREHMDVGLNQWHTDDGENEFTFIFREMPVAEVDIPPFFGGNVSLARKINLTSAEIDFFKGLEAGYLQKYGLDKASAGGYIDIVIHNCEDFGEEGQVLIFLIFGGVEGGNRQEIGLESYARKDKCLLK